MATPIRITVPLDVPHFFVPRLTAMTAANAPKKADSANRQPPTIPIAAAQSEPPARFHTSAKLPSRAAVRSGFFFTVTVRSSAPVKVIVSSLPASCVPPVHPVSSRANQHIITIKKRFIGNDLLFKKQAAKSEE